MSERVKNDMLTVLRMTEYAALVVAAVALVLCVVWGWYESVIPFVGLFMWVLIAGVWRRSAARWERQAETWRQLCDDYQAQARAQRVADEELLGRIHEMLAWAEQTPAERAAGDA